MEIAYICMLFLLLPLACEGGYTKKRPAGCYYSRRQCEAKCCCTGKRCEPTTVRGRTYYKCVIVDCGRLSDPVNGTVTTLGGTKFESLASYRCDEGYVLSYPASRTCLSSGLWSGTSPRCDPETVCGKEECPTLEPPCNGLLVDVPTNLKPGDVATFDCLDGFELDGDKNGKRTCKEDYTWDGMPLCCVKTCRQMAEYSHTYDGSSYRVVQTPMNWLDAQENCKSDGAKLVEIEDDLEDDFIVDGTIDVGGANFWMGGNDITVEGEWVWPEENVIFYSNSTSGYFTNWDSDGPNGGYDENCMMYAIVPTVWDDEECHHLLLSICECKLNDFDCGPLPDPTNGKVVTPIGTTLELLATYSCDDGYVLSQTGSRICLSSGQWSDTAPTCEPVDCGPLDSPCGASVSMLGTTVGSVATYSCDPGFSLVGDETRTCQSYGYWSGSVPCCENKCSQLPGYYYTYGSSVYKVIREQVIYEVAKAACIADGTNLVKVENQGEQSFLDEIIGDDYDYWIGLFQVSEGNWIWISDNSSLSSTGFEVWAGDPDDYDCAAIDGGEWYDYDCTDDNKYICECDSLM